MRLIIGEIDQLQCRIVMPVALEAKAKTTELRMLLVCRHILEKSKPQKYTNNNQLNICPSEYKAIANSTLKARNTKTLAAWRGLNVVQVQRHSSLPVLDSTLFPGFMFDDHANVQCLLSM